MENLKESILTQVLNNANVQIDKEFYISYSNIQTILNANLVEHSQIINERNLREDFIEGLENLLKRDLTSEEIKELDNSDFIDNVCINDMFQAESDSISSYYQQYFVNKKR